MKTFILRDPRMLVDIVTTGQLIKWRCTFLQTRCDSLDMTFIVSYEHFHNMSHITFRLSYGPTLKDTGGGGGGGGGGGMVVTFFRLIVGLYSKTNLSNRLTQQRARQRVN